MSKTEPTQDMMQASTQNQTVGNHLLGFHSDGLQDQVYIKVLQSRQFLDKSALELYSSKAYCTYKQQDKGKKLADILFNDKYEILLWEYLDKYKGNRFAAACYNHFSMVKELYRNKGKKTMTVFGFYSIMATIMIMNTEPGFRPQDRI